MIIDMLFPGWGEDPDIPKDAVHTKLEEEKDGFLIVTETWKAPGFLFTKTNKYPLETKEKSIDEQISDAVSREDYELAAKLKKKRDGGWFSSNKAEE